MTPLSFQSTGVPGLDQMLGGGLLPGTLAVVVGATGIGKTQLGLQYAHAGREQDKKPGVLFDLITRGDSQNHADYARRMFDWNLSRVNGDRKPDLERFFDLTDHGDYFRLFERLGKQVRKEESDFDSWHTWQSELNNRLSAAIAFLYGSFTSGRRRVVIDGFEPLTDLSQSIQFEVFHYIYHQILRKDGLWVARDLFRQSFRKIELRATAADYDSAQIGCMALLTSHEVMLDDLISCPIADQDLLSGSNTIIYMGKTRDNNRLGRAIYVAKHRGCACSDQIESFQITDRGIEMI